MTTAIEFGTARAANTNCVPTTSKGDDELFAGKRATVAGVCERNHMSATFESPSQVKNTRTRGAYIDGPRIPSIRDVTNEQESDLVEGKHSG
ncbi:MAG: hypothetical protein JWO85_2257 [Candidatus Eremiobacteraeota bacterium]|nr:hypothetical protein [Candidatus Eremiobacteraeota bacterium]